MQLDGTILSKRGWGNGGVKLDENTGVSLNHLTVWAAIVVVD
jgi:hypothetical protein